jgi:hypothetical protein
MKSAVAGIVIFPETIGAQGEPGHGSVRPVIRNGCGYGITGAAVRAVDERIQVAAVGRVEHFMQAIIAY